MDEDKLNGIEIERYQYVTKNGVPVTFQRLAKDSTWYAVSGNQIVNYGQYRNDIQEWCDMFL